MIKMEIYSKIPAIIADIKAIGKTHKNSFQGYMFRGIDDVYNVVNQLLGKHKVSIYPNYKIISEVIGETKKGTEQKTVVVKGIYKLVAEDGSFETVETIGEASDTSDKAYNKAMSTAFKYALFQVFCIPTEEKKDTEHESLPVTKSKSEPVKDLFKNQEEEEKNKAEILIFKKINEKGMKKEEFEKLFKKAIGKTSIENASRQELKKIYDELIK